MLLNIIQESSAAQIHYSNDWRTFPKLLLEVVRELVLDLMQQLFTVPRWGFPLIVWYGFKGASFTVLRLLMMLPYILYTCIESLLCQHSLWAVGSMWVSGGAFPAAIVRWCMGCCLGLVHLSHCALFSPVMQRCELSQIFSVDVWCYNGVSVHILGPLLDGKKHPSTEANKWGKGIFKILICLHPLNRLFFS